MRRNDVVIVQKPLENMKNLMESGTLMEKVKNSASRSPVWKIKMTDGTVEYCEENFLIMGSEQKPASGYA